MTKSATPSAPAWSRTLGAIPSGLFVLTCDQDYSVVSWVQQAGFEPPTISVALKTGRAVAAPVLAGKPFTLSVLPEGGLKLAKPFFTGNAAPALDAHGVVKGALGHLVCRHAAHVASGDHTIILATVSGGEFTLAHAKPHVHIRKDGTNY